MFFLVTISDLFLDSVSDTQKRFLLFVHTFCATEDRICPPRLSLFSSGKLVDILIQKLFFSAENYKAELLAKYSSITALLLVKKINTYIPTYRRTQLQHGAPHPTLIYLSVQTENLLGLLQSFDFLSKASRTKPQHWNF